MYTQILYTFVDRERYGRNVDKGGMKMMMIMFMIHCGEAGVLYTHTHIHTNTNIAWSSKIQQNINNNNVMCLL